MNSNRDHVEIYCKGVCSGNPGPGAWAAILICRGQVKEICGFELQTTNNRMEIAAGLKAIESLRRPCFITLYSDSRYLVNGGNGEWGIESNLDLWRSFFNIGRTHDIVWRWVKGHSGIPESEWAGHLAKSTLLAGVDKQVKRTAA